MQLGLKWFRGHRLQLLAHNNIIHIPSYSAAIHLIVIFYMKGFKAAMMDKAQPFKMECQVKPKFDLNEKHKAATNTLAESKCEEMLPVSTCLILLVLAQLYPMSWI